MNVVNFANFPPLIQYVRQGKRVGTFDALHCSLPPPPKRKPVSPINPLHCPSFFLSICKGRKLETVYRKTVRFNPDQVRTIVYRTPLSVLRILIFDFRITASNPSFSPAHLISIIPRRETFPFQHHSLYLPTNNQSSQ
jgi:hypothetical protein